MGNTLIYFDGQYFQYDGGHSIEEKGLTIGDYESAWPADLAMSYLLKTAKQSMLANNQPLPMLPGFTLARSAKLS